MVENTQEEIQEEVTTGEEQEKQTPPPEEETVTEETTTTETEEKTPPETEAQKLQSWVGRRDKQMREEFQQTITQNNQTLLTQIQGMYQQQAPAPAADQEEWDYDNPEKSISAALDKRAQGEKQYDQGVINGINYMIINDPVLKDNEELKQEVTKQAFAFNMGRESDPGINAQLRVLNAKNNVLSQKVTEKINPLNANQPNNTPLGGITSAPGGGQPRTPKMPTLSSEARKIKEAYGYTDEQVAEILNKD